MRIFRWWFAPLEEREAGRIVTMVPLISFAALICVGIGVDFSGQVTAEQELRDQAWHCARVGAGQIGMTANSALAATTAASRCLDDHGLTGTVALTGDSVIVEVSGTYQTKLLTALGINQLPIQAAASSSILQGH
ncbi:MAG: hypothetical protein FWD55_01665 [Propionibacteriaceae bacterium]|nr:hypothetical protein [Propionibacteriaceae bacterium]